MLKRVLTTMAVVMAICAIGKASAASDIVIGQSAPIRGAVADFANAYRDGAALYFDNVNRQGGVHGRNIRLVTLDDGYDAKTAEDNARQLIERDNALALFGFMFANTVRASIPVAARAGVPYVAPFIGYDEVDDFNPVVFTTFGSLNGELHTLVRHMEVMGLKRVVMVRYDSPAGKTLEQSLSSKMGVANVPFLGSAELPLIHKIDEAAMTAAATRLAELQPSAVYIAVSGEHAAQFIRKFNAVAKVKPVQFMARSLVDGPLLIRRLGDESRGVVTTQMAPSPFNGKTRIAREYRAELKRALQDGKAIKPNYTGFMGYIGAKVLVEGLRRSGPNPTRAGLIRALESIQEWDAGDLTFNYSPINHHGSNFVTVTVIGAGGHFIE